MKEKTKETLVIFSMIIAFYAIGTLGITPFFLWCIASLVNYVFNTSLHYSYGQYVAVGVLLTFLGMVIKNYIRR